MCYFTLSWHPITCKVYKLGLTLTPKPNQWSTKNHKNSFVTNPVTHLEHYLRLSSGFSADLVMWWQPKSHNMLCSAKFWGLNCWHGCRWFYVRFFTKYFFLLFNVTVRWRLIRSLIMCCSTHFQPAASHLLCIFDFFYTLFIYFLSLPLVLLLPHRQKTIWLLLTTHVTWMVGLFGFNNISSLLLLVVACLKWLQHIFYVTVLCEKCVPFINYTMKMHY